jgi:hypothetical protein
MAKPEKPATTERFGEKPASTFEFFGTPLPEIQETSYFPGFARILVVA